jgi:hypothetical protein
MANTKISQLPIYSGTAADLRWFVMNDSGETTTFKFSGYTSQLIPGSGTDSYRTINSTGSTGTRAIAIGKGSSAAGTDSVSIGDISGYNLGTGSINIGRHSQVAGDFAIAIGNNAFVSGSDSISIGRETAAYNGGIVLGGNVSRATGTHSITIGNNNERNLGAGYSSIMGYGNKIGDPPNFNPGPYNNIIASFSVINGDNSTIGYNNIFGGTGNIITGTTTGTTLLGISNSTGPLENDTVYLNNLKVLRTPSTQVQPISSGTTFTCNLDNGAKSQFYITGTSTINITNVRDGASFIIKTQTNGNYNITWTATGYTFVFEGGLKDPGNTTTDLFVFEVFGSVIYGNRRHNYS